MKEILRKYAAKRVNKVSVLATVTVKNNTDAPALCNYKCHHNTAWYLNNDKNTVAVAEGYYHTSGVVIAHFVCLHIEGYYFDPTIPAQYLDDEQFHIVRLHTECISHNADNADTNLLRMKKELRDCLPFPLNKLAYIDTF